MTRYSTGVMTVRDQAMNSSEMAPLLDLCLYLNEMRQPHVVDELGCSANKLDCVTIEGKDCDT